MDVLDFIARSEWPLVVAGTIWILRGPLRELIDRINLTKIDAWGLKAEFDKSLETIETTLAPPSEQNNEQTSKRAIRALNFMYEFRSSPEVMVLDAWKWIEVTMRGLLEELEPTSEEPYEEQIDIDAVARKLGLRDDEIDSILTLHRLRNIVAHSMTPPITWEEAKRFKKVAEQLRLRMLDIRDLRKGNRIN